ncbi:hypothetical protein EJ07DRAFT_81705, partial [Lizonia empirigonia]
PHRALSLFPSFATRLPTNRLFDSVRQPQDLHTLSLLNAASNRALITLWSARWSAPSQAVTSLVKALIADSRVNSSSGGLGFAEVETDSPLIGDLPLTYGITSIPTLLAFSRQEAQVDTKLVRPQEMQDEEFLREWLRTEARRGGRK